ncbi:MAG: EamA family transporter, partial [Anaerolineales bacterium]
QYKGIIRMNFIGELAALATSFFFAMTALIFTRTGRMVGAQVTNRMRLTFALIYLIILNTVLFQEPLPFSADSSRWLWLGLSGIIGLSLGDAFFFQALVAVGPRVGSLLLSLAPIFGSIIAWVVLSPEEPPETPRGHTRRGVLFGILAGLGQAMGLVLSKQGMFGDFSPFQANAIRMLTAVIFIWGWTAFDGKIGATFTTLRDKPRVIGLIALGAVIGPLLGVSASLLAVQHAEVGVASTLMAYTKSHPFFSRYCPKI